MDADRQLTAAPDFNPYVGPREFRREEKWLFFGRDREARDLLALIASNRLVVFHAQSGTGKTSLINTCIVPELEDRGFEVLPPARVGGAVAGPAEANVFALNLMLSLDNGQDDPARFQSLQLAEFLLSLEAEDGAFYYRPALEPEPAPASESPAGEPPAEPVKPRVLIIDQFEELFNTHLDAWWQRGDFMDQLAKAMEADPYLWIVLAMREDYIAELDPYANRLAGGLRTRYYMQRMGAEGALQAVTRPVAKLRPFEPKAAQDLVDMLSRIQQGVDAAGQPLYVKGESIEPFQLQVVCHQLWEYLRGQPGTTITEDDLKRLSQAGAPADGARSLDIIGRALRDFYESALAQAKGPGVTERRLRRWIAEELITPQETRGLAADTSGLPEAAVSVLESRRLIRGELRGNRKWYELTHDRLVAPILLSNQAWEATRQTPLRATAMQWQTTQNNSLLYSGQTLEQARAWVDANPEDVEPYEQDFLSASQKAQEAWDRQQKDKMQSRQRRLLVGLLAALGVIVVVMTGLTVAAIQGQTAAQTANTQAAQALGVSLQRGTEVAVQVTEVARQASTAVVAQGQAQQQAATAILAQGEARQQAATAQAAQAQAAQALGVSLQRGTEVAVQATEVARQAATAQAASIQAVAQQGTAVAERATAVWATTQIADSKDQLQQELSRQLAAQAQSQTKTNLELALLLGVEAFKAAQTSDAADVLSQTVRLASGVKVEPAGVPLPQRPHSILGLDFSPDGAHLGWCGIAGWYGIRDLRTNEEWRYQKDPSLQMFSLSITLSQTLAVSDSATDIILADTATGVFSETLSSYATATTIDFAPGGALLAAGLTNGTIRLWAFPSAEVSKMAGLTGIVWAVAFSPNGRWLASGDGAGNIGLWNPATRQNVVMIKQAHHGTVRAIAWSPDSSWFVSGGTDGRLIVWDATTGTMLGQPLRERDGITYALAISADGGVLASGGEGQHINFYNVHAPAHPTLLHQTINLSVVRALAFSPTESVLVTGDEQGNINQYRVVLSQPVTGGASLVDQACALAGRNFTDAEWQQFMGNETYRKTCPNLP